MAKPCLRKRFSGERDEPGTVPGGDAGGEVHPAERHLLKVLLENDRVQAKLGSMVAHKCGVRFEHQTGGLGRFFKKAMAGEGVKLMACECRNLPTAAQAPAAASARSSVTGISL